MRQTYLREHRQAKKGHSQWDFLITRERTADDQIETLQLNVAEGAAITLALWAAAAAGQARSGRLEARFTVDAAQSNLATATTAIRVIVTTTVDAANRTAEVDVLLVDSVSSCSSFPHGHRSQSLQKNETNDNEMKQMTTVVIKANVQYIQCMYGSTILYSTYVPGTYCAHYLTHESL